MGKHTQTIRRQKPTNCLSVFDHFVRLAVEGLTQFRWMIISEKLFIKTTVELIIFFLTSVIVETVDILIYATVYSRMDQVKFVENSLQKNWSDMVCLNRPYHIKFF